MDPQVILLRARLHCNQWENVVVVTCLWASIIFNKEAAEQKHDKKSASVWQADGQANFDVINLFLYTKNLLVCSHCGLYTLNTLPSRPGMIIIIKKKTRGCTYILYFVEDLYWIFTCQATFTMSSKITTKPNTVLYIISIFQISAVTTTQNPDSSVTVLRDTGRANFVGRRSSEHVLRNYEAYDDFLSVML